MSSKYPKPYMTLEDRSEVQAEFNKQRSERTEAALEFFGRQLAHALGAEYFEEMAPADRKHAYAVSPPIDLDTGMVSPWLGPGSPNWPLIAAEFPARFAARVEDYVKLVKAEAEKVGM